MTFTYFDMLVNYSKKEEYLIKEKIIEICNIEEIIKASNKLQHKEAFKKAELLRNKRIDEIYNELIEIQKKRRIINIIKKFLKVLQ